MEDAAGKHGKRRSSSPQSGDDLDLTDLRPSCFFFCFIFFFLALFTARSIYTKDYERHALMSSEGASTD